MELVSAVVSAASILPHTFSTSSEGSSFEVSPGHSYTAPSSCSVLRHALTCGELFLPVMAPKSPTMIVCWVLRVAMTLNRS
eukprot:1338362-Heterocapsa_arctica.AAC.1